MSRFKFRAWDKQDKIMRSIILMDFNDWRISCKPAGGKDSVEYGERNSFNNEETDRYIIMQCTGLSAKKSYRGERPGDLLIFEGDILGGYDFKLDECENWLVIWDNDRWAFCLDENCPTWDIDIDKIESMTILGNVHDNPKLLKENGNE